MANADVAVKKLIARRLIDPRTLFEGRFTFAEHRHRRGILLGKAIDGSGVFVKFPSSTGGESALEGEARVYEAINAIDVAANLRRFMPRFHFYDWVERMLVLESLDRAIDGDNALVRLPDIELGGQLGKALAACHSINCLNLPDLPRQFKNVRPWALEFIQPPPDVFRQITPLQLDVLRIAQSPMGLVDNCADLANDWTPSCLTHGDVRWSNVLVEGDSSGLHDLRIVDWEHAGFGDPAWDIASVISAYLGAHLRSLPLWQCDDTEAAISTLDDSLGLVSKRICAFWGEYQSHVRETDGAAPLDLSKTMKFTGLRLVQFVFEWAALRSEMPRFALLALQLASNIARDPAAAAEMLTVSETT